MTATDLTIVVALFSAVMLGAALGAWLFDRMRTRYRSARLRREFRRAMREWEDERLYWP